MNLNTLERLTWGTLAAAVASAVALAVVAPAPTRAAEVLLSLTLPSSEATIAPGAGPCA